MEKTRCIIITFFAVIFIAKKRAMQTWYSINGNQFYHKSIESYIYKNKINQKVVYENKNQEKYKYP